MREKIIVALYKIALVLSCIADSMRTDDIYDKEYHIFAFGKDGWFC